jgi:hypothetical protein
MKILDLPGTKAHIRYKKKGGLLVPGVTTITGQLDKRLKYWANELGLQGVSLGAYTNALAGVGTLAHHLVMCDITDQKPDTSDFSPKLLSLAENALCSWYEWRKNHELKTGLYESPLVSEKYGYGGTPDWYGKLDGVFTVVDFKTSDNIYEEHRIQIVAYMNLIKEAGYPVYAARIVRIGRDETEGFGDYPITNLAGQWRVFLGLLEVYNARREAGKS